MGQNLSSLGKIWLWAFVILAALLVLGMTIKRALDQRIRNRQNAIAAQSDPGKLK